MSFLRIVGMNSLGSAEREISAVLKEEMGKKLESAKVEDGYCKLVFTESSDVTVKKTIVKEFSMKKYGNTERALIVFNNRRENQYCFFGCTCPIWRQLQVIELPNSWLMFFER